MSFFCTPPPPPPPSHKNRNGSLYPHIYFLVHYDNIMNFNNVALFKVSQSCKAYFAIDIIPKYSLLSLMFSL